MCDINLKYQLFIRHRTYDLLRLFMYHVLKGIYFYKVVEKLFLISKKLELVEQDKTLCLDMGIIKIRNESVFIR